MPALDHIKTKMRLMKSSDAERITCVCQAEDLTLQATAIYSSSIMVNISCPFYLCRHAHSAHCSDKVVSSSPYALISGRRKRPERQMEMSFTSANGHDTGVTYNNSTQAAVTGGHQKVWNLTRLSRAMGFTKVYNLPLFVILGGAMLGFSISRLEYLDITGRFAMGAAPGEWYWYRAGHYHIGIILHLACILPAGLLMIWQFVPIIRHKFIYVHRLNGYIVVTLVILSNIGTLMIARRSFGGLLSTQAAIGLLVMIVTIAMALAWWNIRCLQIDQHRAWMLRAMVWLGTYKGSFITMEY